MPVLIERYAEGVPVEIMISGSDLSDFRTALDEIARVAEASSVTECGLRTTIRKSAITIRRIMDGQEKLSLPSLGSSEGSEVDDSSMHGLL